MKQLTRYLITGLMLSVSSLTFAQSSTVDAPVDAATETTTELLSEASQIPCTPDSTDDNASNPTELGCSEAEVVDKLVFDEQLLSINLDEYLGKNKWTVVEIWASNCHQCDRHMPEMVEFDGKLKNLDIIGITLDGVDGREGLVKAEAFAERHGITFKNIISTSSAVDTWMRESVGEGLRGTPTFLILNPEGKFIAAQPGAISVEKLEKYILSKSKAS